METQWSGGIIKGNCAFPLPSLPNAHEFYSCKFHRAGELQYVFSKLLFLVFGVNRRRIAGDLSKGDKLESDAKKIEWETRFFYLPLPPFRRLTTLPPVRSFARSLAPMTRNNHCDSVAWKIASVSSGNPTPQIQFFYPLPHPFFFFIFYSPLHALSYP